MRLRGWLVAVPLTLLIAACGSSGAQTQAAPSLVQASAPTHGYQPIKLAVCGQTPPNGSYQLQYRDDTGQPIRPVNIRHTKVDCGKPFTEYVDFTFLGDWPTCAASPLAPDYLRRPCDEAFKLGPDFRTITLNDGQGEWRPVEGKDPLRVECQSIGNRIVGQGTLRNDRGVGSNVWNRIRDPHIQGGVGYINDIWTANAGYRGRLC